MPEIWIWTAIAVGVVVLLFRAKSWGGPKPLRYTFAAKLSEDNQPVDEKTTFSVDDGRMVLFVDWDCPGVGPYTYRCRIFDGQRRKVHESAASMTPQHGAWSTWTWYDFDPRRDQPGHWRVEISVDQTPVLSAVVDVTAGASTATA